MKPPHPRRHFKALPKGQAKSRNLKREMAIQKACHALMETHAPAAGCVYHSIPNEAKRSVVEGAAMKAMGLRAGCADYLILWKGEAIYIEFKCPKDVHGDKTYQSKDQKKFEAWVNKSDSVFYFVVRSTAEFVGVLAAFGLLRRVRIA